MRIHRREGQATTTICLVAAAAAILLCVSGCGTAGASGGGGTTGSPTVSTNPTSLSFGSVSIGTTSSKTVIVSNTGSADLVVSSVTVTGAGFALSPVQFPLTIAPSSSYTATITFSPKAAGSVTGSATVSSNAAGSPTSVSFDGTGVSTPAPAMSVAPTSLAFGNVTVGSTSTNTAAITNSGNPDLIISGIAVTGSGFSLISTTFPLTVTAGTTYTASFRFSPTAAGAASGAATISSNAGGSSPVVSLTGTGVTAAIGTLNANPPSVSFGNVTVGSSSTKTVTLSNTGNASVQVSAINISGSGFTSNTSVPFTVSAGATGTFSIVFSPQSSGAGSGTASVVSNASNSTLNVPLSGSGVTASSHTIGLTWVASPSVIKSYNIYRGSQTGGPYQLISSSSSTAYTDSGVFSSGQIFFYVVTAVDNNGIESAFSNEASATIP